MNRAYKIFVCKTLFKFISLVKSCVTVKCSRSLKVAQFDDSVICVRTSQRNLLVPVIMLWLWHKYPETY